MPETVMTNTLTRAGDLVLLISTDHKRYVMRLQPGQTTHTHFGALRHDELIGVPWGGAVQSHSGHSALLLEPGLTDLIQQLKRGTQIIYPKDAAYIVHRLSLRSGHHVIEAGTGSGGLTTALAWAVAPSGVVHTHEARSEVLNVARENLERVGMLPYVRLHQVDIEHGFKAVGADALVLDVREPWLYLEHVRAALKPGGFFAALVPTVNQVIELLRGFEVYHFADVAVEELLLRPYKPTADRLRPDDTAIPHTGFLLFARNIDASEEMGRWQQRERQRYEARLKARAELELQAQQRAAERADGGKKYPRLPLP
jgi:tRNA (adenine57-N1/adenine58-N1)-methyltransferase catalytic subunit